MHFLVVPKKFLPQLSTTNEKDKKVGLMFIEVYRIIMGASTKDYLSLEQFCHGFIQCFPIPPLSVTWSPTLHSKRSCRETGYRRAF